jgi:hypothetical protein
MAKKEISTDINARDSRERVWQADLSDPLISLFARASHCFATCATDNELSYLSKKGPKDLKIVKTAEETKKHPWRTSQVVGRDVRKRLQVVRGRSVGVLK